MDLRELANSISNTVNPNVFVTIQASAGYTNSGKGLRQVPTYAEAVSGYAQVQELSSSELRQVDGMNLQGVVRTIYLRGRLNGVIRPESIGGDLVTIDGHLWLTVKTLESWPLWTKAMIVRQEMA